MSLLKDWKKLLVYTEDREEKPFMLTEKSRDEAIKKRRNDRIDDIESLLTSGSESGNTVSDSDNAAGDSDNAASDSGNAGNAGGTDNDGGNSDENSEKKNQSESRSDKKKRPVAVEDWRRSQKQGSTERMQAEESKKKPEPGTAKKQEPEKDNKDNKRNIENKNKKSANDQKDEKDEKESGKVTEIETIDDLDKSLKDIPVKMRVDDNLKAVQILFRMPENIDIVIREFTVRAVNRKGFIAYIDGATHRDTINRFILEPLMTFTDDVLMQAAQNNQENLCQKMTERLLPGNQIKIVQNFDEVITAIVNGDTAIFVDACPMSILIETKGWEHRSVSNPSTEEVIRGPHEGFTEYFRTNVSLVRKLIRDQRVMTELVEIGGNRNPSAIMYIDGLVNPTLVEEVKKRLGKIRFSHMYDSGMVEQLIEDKRRLPMPQVISTERPDRVASYIEDGKVSIFVDGSPYALVVPCTFFSLLHAAEDAYLKWPFATFLRIVRVFSLLLSLFLPGLYIAISNYHQEMIPTDLLLAIAASREMVPFPTIVEVLLMEVSFELIREGGIRIPGIVGPTLGIIGALILGQAAVNANIVSPVLIIIVALTGLGSFAVPNYSLSFALRIARFFFILMGSVLGLFGISVGLMAMTLILVSMRSFGVPYFAPVAPKTRSFGDLIHREPADNLSHRPDYENTLQREKGRA